MNHLIEKDFAFLNADVSNYDKKRPRMVIRYHRIIYNEKATGEFLIDQN